MGTSIVLVAVGAILKGAVTPHANGFDIQTAGTVVFIVGLVGLALAILYTFWWADSVRRRPYDDTRVIRRDPPPPAV